MHFRKEIRCLYIHSRSRSLLFASVRSRLINRNAPAVILESNEILDEKEGSHDESRREDQRDQRRRSRCGSGRTDDRIDVREDERRARFRRRRPLPRRHRRCGARGERLLPAFPKADPRSDHLAPSKPKQNEKRGQAPFLILGQRALSRYPLCSIALWPCLAQKAPVA